MAYGDIGTVIDTYEFDPAFGAHFHIIHIDGDVYAIAYRDTDTNCRLKTIEIAGNGQITEPYIDDLIVHARDGMMTRIQWVFGNIYVIAGRDSQFRNTMSTVEILTNGQIGAAAIDSFGWVTVSNTYHSWARRSNTILALAFQGYDQDGFLYSIEIDAAGNITKPQLDTFEFDDVLAQPGNIAQVNGGMFAIPYHGPVGHGWLKTFTLGLLGQLPAAATDSLEFDPVRAVGPWLTQVHEGIYAIPYQGPTNYGKICTVSITDAGAISNAVLDSMEFDPTFCGKPTSVSCGGNILAIAYTGPDNDGWLATLEIAPNGAITDPPLATFEFDPANCIEPSIIRIAGNVYAIAYEGVDADGYLKTVGIESPLGVGPDHSLMIGIGP